MHLVGTLACPRLDQAHTVGAGGAAQLATIHGAAAQMIGSVVTDQALSVAVELVRAQGVHPSDQGRAVSRRAHRVGVRWDAGVQDVLVCPHLILVWVPARQHRHPRGHADRGGTVGIPKEHSSARQPVEVRCLHQGIAIASGDKGAVLVRMDVEKTGRLTVFHAPLLACGSSCQDLESGTSIHEAPFAIDA